jgi:hypothetical protein
MEYPPPPHHFSNGPSLRLFGKEKLSIFCCTLGQIKLAHLYAWGLIRQSVRIDEDDPITVTVNWALNNLKIQSTRKYLQQHST